MKIITVPEKEEGDGASVPEEGLGRKIYKALMNGVSHMLPFVIGGGILMALSYLCDGQTQNRYFRKRDPSCKIF